MKTKEGEVHVETIILYEFRGRKKEIRYARKVGKRKKRNKFTQHFRGACVVLHEKGRI